ncbi:hypothetical protein GALMADRAFT_126504 [Galerina marginata CBS 339.88]|uniref:SWIM-type domain-containing protein n=1 Tax=Galerina marginata (strain CBS 339.88) TaxID=685588 RepID=A0A067SN05_GALM3|nr:hypothetical protein GALMADRAFT_126504 [Galerina marginata CBS 339.88]
MPTTEHFYCINHLDGNVDKNLGRLIPSANWAEFKSTFWDVYRAVSPEDFDLKWNEMTAKFPQAKNYLDAELYPCREKWAWVYTSYQFTCGVRTNGRVEVENRVNKAIGGPKKTLLQLFHGLNERTNGQTAQEMIRVRESSRRQHPSNIESIFPGPLSIIRQFAGPFALQTCFKQMELSLFYSVKVLQLPDGMHDWNEYAIAVGPTVGYSWENGEETRMLNSFENDNSHISTKWLLRLIKGRGLRVVHLLCVSHDGTDAFHMLALLPDDNYICDCCMGMMSGVPCRHYFRVLSSMKNLKFNIGVIRPRWYQDNNLDTHKVPVVPAREAQIRCFDIEMPAMQQTARIHANPLELNPGTPTPPPTQTLPARTVFHEANAALAPLTNGIQTQEQLDELLDDLNALRESRRQAAAEGRIYDPPVLNPKGRPRQSRITSALEGQPRGGGAQSASRGGGAGRKCGLCRQPGHTRTNCPLAPP